MGSARTVSILVDFDATVNSRFSGLFEMPLIVRELPEIRTFWTAYPGNQRILAGPDPRIHCFGEAAAHALADITEANCETWGAGEPQAMRTQLPAGGTSLTCDPP